MRIKTKLYWIVLALLISLFLVSGCGTGGQSEALFEPTPTPGLVHIGTPVEITLDESIACLYGYAVENDVLIGQARQAGQIQPVVLDLTTGQAYQLGVEGTQFSNETVRYVAQVRDSDAQTNLADLSVYDLLAGNIITITQGQLRRPWITGNTIVWEEYRDGGRNIYGYDLSQGRQFVVTETKGAAGFPYIFGNWVVYLFQDAKEQPIHMLRAHNTATGDDFEIGLVPMQPGDYPPERFKISENRVAWIGIKRNEIHVYDLETRTDEIIFTDDSPYLAVLGGLDMEGDIVMWGGPLSGYVGYDLLHNQLFDIPDLPQVSGERAIISEKCVVWVAEEPNPWSDYLMTPMPTGEPKPTLPPELVEAAKTEQCQKRLFVAPITRQ